VKLFLGLADLPFYEIDDPFGFGHGVVFRQSADDHARAIEEDHRRSQPFAFGVRNDLRLAIHVDVRHGAECRAEIDSNYFSSCHGRR
jgi:hypothetical protein